MAPLLRFETAERGFAHNVVERRSPQAGFNIIRLVESEAVYSTSNPVLLERRDTIDGPSGAPVVSTPPLTASTKALAGLIVFLGIVVLGVAGLRLRKFMRNRGPKPFRSPRLKPLSLCESPLPEKIISEKRNPMYTQTLIDFGYDGIQPPSKVWTSPSRSKLVYSDSEAQYVGWVPQIKSWPEDSKDASSPDLIPRPFPAPTPPAPVALKVSRLSRLAAVFTRSPRPSEASFDIDAVPPYTSAAPTPRSISPMLGSVPSTQNAEQSPSFPKERRSPRNLSPILVTEPSTKIPRVPVLALDAVPVPAISITDETQTVTVDSVSNATAEGNAMKSPTRLDSALAIDPFASFVDNEMLKVSEASHRNSRISSSSTRHLSSGSSFFCADRENEIAADPPQKKLPRLVLVVNLFSPNLKDELHVRLGEVLRLTHEFRDGWCALERLGAEDEQGVVPRFCIAERVSVVPDYAKSQHVGSGAHLTFTGSSTGTSSMTATEPRLSKTVS